jgi:hypothetical protein
MRVRWVRQKEHMGRSGCGILLGKPEGKKEPGRFRRRWDGNTKNDLKEIFWIVDWLHVT